MNKSVTDFPFVRPSFIEGMARVLDLGGTLNIYDKNLFNESADSRAIAGDFQAVGCDLWVALTEYGSPVKK